MQQQTPTEIIRAISILHAAFIFGIVFFAVIALILSSTQNNGNPELVNVFQIIVPLVFIGSFISGRMLFRKKLLQINPQATLPKKLEEYRVAALIMYAMLEGAAFLSVIAALITGILYFLLITGLIVVVFALLKPGVTRISQDLNLSAEEVKLLSPAQ